MNTRKPLLTAVCAVLIGAIALPMTANAAVSVYLNFAPPQDRYEVVPAPRHGYEWSNGYWDSQDRRQVWQPGHWERVREGYSLAQPHWVKYDARWKLVRGHWQKGQHHQSGGHHEQGHDKGNGHGNGKSKNH